MVHQQKEKNHYIFSSQLRADQMPGPPGEGQLMWTLFVSICQEIEQHQRKQQYKWLQLRADARGPQKGWPLDVHHSLNMCEGVFAHSPPLED